MLKGFRVNILEMGSSAGKQSSSQVQHYNENQPWGSTTYEVVPGSYISFHTDHQLVEFITNPTYGRMLFLDGVLQSTRSDQHIYHEALLNCGKGKLGNVLIAGGAEGDLAALCLNRGASHVQMNDWDSQLVYHIQRVEKWNPELWANPKFSYSSKDIVRFCEETAQSFDTVFLDLLDVDSEHDKAQMRSILHWVQMVCEPTATVVLNIGRCKETAETFADLLGDRSKVCEMSVPSFQETWYFVHCEKGE